MEYKILNKYNIQDYLYTITSIKEYFDGQKLFVDEIGDGNLNYVFLIKSTVDQKKVLILKQAVPYLRCLGEKFLLKKERMSYEIRALKNFSKTSSLHIPKLYHTSENMATVIMQFLDKHMILREGIINQTIYPKFSDHVSTYLASNLFKTSSLNLNSSVKRELIDNFNSNSELCKLTEDFVFTFAFMEHISNDISSKNNEEFQNLILDMHFKNEVLSLKYKFMTQCDALVHGDFHTGSIMLNEDDTFIIDPEFAFIGPFGFDIGALLANLTMSYISHICLNTKAEYIQWLEITIEEVLEKFEEKFLVLWNKKNDSALITEGFVDEEHLEFYKQEFMLNILKDSVGFAGCKMARRMFGAAGVAEIREIENKEIKNKAIHKTLNIAKRFVTERNMIRSVNDVMNIIKDESN